MQSEIYSEIWNEIFWMKSFCNALLGEKSTLVAILICKIWNFCMRASLLQSKNLLYHKWVAYVTRMCSQERRRYYSKYAILPTLYIGLYLLFLILLFLFLALFSLQAKSNPPSAKVLYVVGGKKEEMGKTSTNVMW